MSEDRGMAASLAGPLLGAVFDEIECGLVVCSGDGRVHLANAAARRELDEGCALRAEQGVLVGCNDGAETLVRAIRRAARSERRALVRVGRSDSALMLGVQPLHDPRTDARLVLVVLGRHVPCSEISLELLATQNGLTMMERRVLAALLRDTSPNEIAASHDVALSTIRSQIASIREKLDARSIDHLLLRVAALPPIAGALQVARAWTGCQEMRRAA
jgi:DNA-binding CsgD family transcriptional regulator